MGPSTKCAYPSHFRLFWVDSRPFRGVLGYFGWFSGHYLGVSEASLALLGGFKAISRGFRGILAHFGLFWWLRRHFWPKKRQTILPNNEKHSVLIKIWANQNCSFLHHTKASHY